MKRMSFVAVLSLFALSLAACGSSSGSSSTGLNSATSVTGTCRSASGDPMPGTTVYLPGVAVAAQVAKATRSFDKAVTASDGTTCEDPASADQSLASACSAQDGSFTINTSAVTSNPTQIVFVKGALRMVKDLSCTGTTCALESSSTSFGGTGTTWPRVAVVTGAYDRMEDVLAKLADSNTGDETNGSYGRVNSSSGVFVYGSEYGTNLTIIAGGGTSSPTENAESLTYTTWDKYLDGTQPLVSGGSPLFDVIFINCGDDYDDATNLSSAAKTRLQEYVNAGGRLYVTDLSYDFVEQPFPQVMQFEGDPVDPATPGDFGDAETGTSGIKGDAAVNDSSMLSWLGGVAVNGHDASTPGNPENDCSGEVGGYTSHTGAVTSSSKLPTDDFLSGWAHMVGAHTGYSPTIWISTGSGDVSFNDGLDNRPLTVSMGVGSNGGKVIYSSYHTAHTCPTLTFWPQERVLQYLIFEAF